MAAFANAGSELGAGGVAIEQHAVDLVPVDQSPARLLVQMVQPGRDVGPLVAPEHTPERDLRVGVDDADPVGREAAQALDQGEHLRQVVCDGGQAGLEGRDHAVFFIDDNIALDDPKRIGAADRRWVDVNDAAIGVELTPSFLMVPNKSVSGLRFPTEENWASCMLCPRPDCPNRRAPHDPELFERKYRKQAG